MDAKPKTMPGEPVDLTFVVFAFNEEGSLRDTIEDCNAWMRRARRVVQILIMNDGSVDRTPKIADELAREHAHVRVHHMPQNVGQGALLRKAWTLVKTTYYAVIPGDNQFDMRSFDLFVPLIGRYDVILGFANNEEVRGRVRSLLSYMWRIYLLSLYGISSVYLGGLIVLPVDLVRRVGTESDGFLGWYETIVRVIITGATVIQIPFVLRERETGESTSFRPAKNLRDAAKMAVIWTKLKGPGMLPEGREWARLKQIYREYRQANPMPEQYQGDLFHEKD